MLEGLLGVLGSKSSDLDAAGSVTTPVATKPCIPASENTLYYPSPLY